VPISGKPEIGAPPQDEVCGFKLDPAGLLVTVFCGTDIPENVEPFDAI
jgi:hypothetical protein